MKLFTKILMTLIFITSAQSFAEDGQSGNGGTLIQVGSNKYDLADLHFKPAPSVGYTFDAKLIEELKALEKTLVDLSDSTDGSNSYDFREFVETFFENQIFNTLVEYKFVTKLPTQGCNFIPVENLPFNLKTKNVGCTQGSITYLLPQFFSNDKLTLTQLALLIVHERLHAAAPSQPYEIKTDIVRALYILRSKIQVAIQNKDYSFVLNSDDQAVLNRLTYRLSQLGGKQYVKLSFNERGAVLIKPQYINPQAKIYAGSVIINSEITSDDIEIKKSKIVNSSLAGKMNRIENSTITSIHLKVNQLTINNSVLKKVGDDRTLWSSIEGNNIYIANSNLELTSRQASNVVIKNSKGEYTINGSSNISIDNCDSKVEVFLSLSVKISNVTTENQWESSPLSFAGNNLSIENTSFLQLQDREWRYKNESKPVAALAPYPDGISHRNISGNNITLQNSTVEYFEDSASVSGSNINVSNAVFSNALVLGNNIQLSEVKLRDAFVNNLGQKLNLNNVGIYSNSAFNFYGDVDLSRVSSLKSEKALTIGQDNSRLELDGYLKSYSANKYSTFGSSFNINSQKQLNKIVVK